MVLEGGATYQLVLPSARDRGEKLTMKASQACIDFSLDAADRNDEQHGNPDDQSAGHVILRHDNLLVAGETCASFSLTIIYVLEFQRSSYLDWEIIDAFGATRRHAQTARPPNR